VGIIGRNGSGKSTLLQLVCGTLSPTTGDVRTSGRIAALLELGAGFNAEFTGRENVYMNAAVLGLTKGEIARCFDLIEAFADIGEFMDQPVKTYSSGMFVRLAFAVQAHIDASIVVIDEALAVGDVFFRQKCYTRLEHLRNAGAAILLVSHSMPDIEQYCERAVLLDHGSPVFIGSATEATKRYYLLHQSEGFEMPRAETDREEINSLRSMGHNGSGRKAFDLPPPEAFLDISHKPQVSNGQARCTGIALCNADGQPCNVFRQGDRAVFFSVFELFEDIEVPVFGIVIVNERGIIVHGKNSWQTGGEFPLNIKAGTTVVCRQEIACNWGSANTRSR
jgi:lipopolysaccharide transport system ATP-binding protein